MQTPPVGSMWNLAMYDDAMFFIPNEFGRFTIGSTTDGVTQNPAGSVTICIQHTRPDGGRAANWLPAPEGSFNLTMRYYAPLSPVLDKNLRPAPRCTEATLRAAHNDDFGGVSGGPAR